MAIYLLDENIEFPPASLANKEGLLAIAGDLSIERLLMAYRSGIFPWYDSESPILWWSPDPRMVLIPKDFKTSKSLRQVINKGTYEVRFDTSFKEVIEKCASVPRQQQAGTWITAEMISAYTDLHKEGYAHSVETFEDEKLVGGLYGVSIGRAFFGESMFHLQRDASKVALHALVERLRSWEFHFIDAQQKTQHLKSLGARSVKEGNF